MHANESLALVQTLTSEKVLSLDLSVWNCHVWQFADTDDKTVIRIGLEAYYDPEIGFYRPSGGREAFEAATAAGQKVHITGYLFIAPKMLPQASREQKEILGKRWRVWATGSLDIMVGKLQVVEGSNGSLYLEAPMCRLRGRLNGHGITNIVDKVQPWAEEDTIL